MKQVGKFYERKPAVRGLIFVTSTWTSISTSTSTSTSPLPLVHHER
jgi:hypothetical protein